MHLSLIALCNLQLGGKVAQKMAGLPPTVWREAAKMDLAVPLQQDRNEGGTCDGAISSLHLA